MAKRRKYRSRLNWVVIMLVSAVAAVCILSTLQDKYGMEVGLPELEIPGVDAVYDFIDNFTSDAFSSGDNTGDSDEAVTIYRPDVNGDGLTVHILDMAQADSILIQGPKKNVLIDAGENNQGMRVIRYLEQQGIEQLDLVIGTHPHSDHIGGLDTVIENFKVKEVMLPEIEEGNVPTTATYTDLLKAIDDKGLGITVAEPGMKYDLGDGAILTVLGPVAQFSNLNNMSVVSKLVYGDTSFLFMGDAETQAELAILEKGYDLEVDVMQASHHGSSTSSHPQLLDAAKPRMMFISCGLDNSYGHPHREVIERLQQRGIQIYRTDLDGTIAFYTDGQRIYVSTERG